MILQVTPPPRFEQQLAPKKRNSKPKDGKDRNFQRRLFSGGGGGGATFKVRGCNLFRFWVCAFQRSQGAAPDGFRFHMA